MRAATYQAVLKAIARNVRARRKELGISQEEAAHRAGMGARQWQRVESGNGIVLRTLVAAAAGLEVEVADLVRR